MLTISGNAVGRKRPLFEEFSVPPPDAVADGGNTTLRELIECVVRHQVDAFRNRQAERQFIRVLTARQIESGAEAGKIMPGESEVDVQSVDADQAVATALEAFGDGLYLVVVDDQPQHDLDAQVFVQPNSRLTFVRLALLAGG